ncbi:MAG: GNAT family N-acetyltransferase [Oscillospiraceae bacterium]|jgi:ribosomal protein S18 acetylase RimI-like enzyme|nr:GNAT family N-acetyltransferase [Oscillospiraceae bacterium]
MDCEIAPLPREQWEGYTFPFRYISSHYYDAEIDTADDGFSVRFIKKPFETPQKNEFDDLDKLYQSHWIGAEAYGVIIDGTLIAAIEMWKEEWSNRLRVTELWVADDYRRRGIGGALMNLAKQKARGMGCRALMLETQSCNENAIAFYLAQGLIFFGFDRCCYSNSDIEHRGVRIELGMFI